METVELNKRQGKLKEVLLEVLLDVQTRLNEVALEQIIQRHSELIQRSETNFIWCQARYHPVVQEVLDAINRSNIQTHFYCNPWNQKALSLSLQPGKISRARLTTCLKLLTFHSRRDHFCEGHMADAIVQGRIAALLGRIRYLNRGNGY